MAKKENFHPYYIGTEHGRLSFGHVRDSNEISACMLQSGPDGGRHYIVMEETGSAEEGTKGSTKSYCPGTFTVKAGKDIVNYPKKDSKQAAPEPQAQAAPESSNDSNGQRAAIEKLLADAKIRKEQYIQSGDNSKLAGVDRKIKLYESSLAGMDNIASSKEAIVGEVKEIVGKLINDKEEQPRNIPAIWYEAENGDIIIKAPRGRIKLEAESIELTAKGFDGRTGNILMDADDKIALNAQIVDVKSRVSTKIFSESTVDMIGKGIMNVYGGLVDFADRTTKGKPSKTCGGQVSINEERNK